MRLRAQRTGDPTKLSADEADREHGGRSFSLTPLGSQSVAPSEPTISMLVVRGLVEAVEQAGAARADFLSAAQLDAAQLDRTEARLGRSEVSRLCELALDMTCDPALGLHWAERLSERVFVPVSHLLAHCSSLRQAFTLLTQFFPLLADESPYRIVEHDDKVTVYCLPVGDSLRAQRFSAEMIVGGFWRLVRTFDVHALPERACFEYPAPSYQAEYARFFEGQEGFAQAYTGLVFERALLNAPSPQKDDDVREALQELAERRLRRLQNSTPYALRVRDFLVRHGCPHQTDMQSAARALEISVRSLRRRLEAEGKSYDEVLREALATVAKNLLRDQRRTIQDVAYEMGYSDPSTFHRAFKRWTGTTPSAYRESLLNQGV